MTKTPRNYLIFTIPFAMMMSACTIVASTDQDAGTGGGAGTGGSSATGSGGSAGTGGSSGSNVIADASPGAGGAMSDAAASPGDDLCTGPESTPNDDRTHATPYTLNSHLHGCIQSDADLDFYEFTTPTTPAQGGFVQVQVTDVATSTTIEAHLFAAHDNGELGTSYNSTGGGSVFMWFAAQPGATFRVQVSKHYDGVTQLSPYLFTALYTGVPDMYEPNEDTSHAKPITLNTEVNGYFFSGFVDSTPPADTTWSDYYSVTLAASHVKISLQPSTDTNAQFQLFNSNGSQIASQSDSTAGSTVVYEGDLTAAGTYYINARPVYIPITKGEGSTAPPFFTNPYKLMVMQ